MSGSIDHYLKMWNLKDPKIESALDLSETYKNPKKYSNIPK